MFFVYAVREKTTGEYVTRLPFIKINLKNKTPRVYRRICDAKNSFNPWVINQNRYEIVRLTLSNPETIFAPTEIQKWCDENGFELKKKEF